jgi:hypothetical protein
MRTLVILFVRTSVEDVAFTVTKPLSATHQDIVLARHRRLVIVAARVECIARHVAFGDGDL